MTTVASQLDNPGAGEARDKDDATARVVDFLVRLRKIERKGLSIREIIIIYTLLAKPGLNGTDLYIYVEAPQRSSIQSATERLIREGLIVDHKDPSQPKHPNSFHVTPAGLAVWNEIKP